MTISEIKCDECGYSLKESTNSIAYRLRLSSEIIPSHKGAVTDMLIHPQIDNDMHFCHLGCLKKWVIK